MGLETGTFIDDFVDTNPLGTDDRSTADDHLRLIKDFILNTFPNIDAAVNPTPTELNRLVGLLATATELNKMDGFTGTTTELNFLVGVLGAIIDTQGGQTIADLIITNALTINGELVLNAGYSEDADQYTATTGTRILDMDLATYFFPSADLGTAVITFQFDNPASSGRVSSFTMELLGADDATLTWPTSVEWAGGSVPSFTAGRDILTFVTRDGGTTWYGFPSGRDMS